MNNGEQPVHPIGDDQIRPLALAAVLLLRWRTIVVAVVAAVGLGLAIIALQPVTHTASTTLLSSQDQEESGGRAQWLMAQLGGSVPRASGGNPHSRLMGTLLKSRLLADSVIERLGIGQDDGEEAAAVRSILATQTRLKAPGDGSIILEVDDDDPQRALRITTVLPELINSTISRIGTEAALQRQRMLEQQLAYAGDQLMESEQKLVDFQTARETPALEDQARRTLDVAAALQQSVIQKEVEVAQLRRTVTSSNPELRAAVGELDALRAQLRRLAAGEPGEGQVLLSLRQSPELKVASTRVLREFTKDEQIYISLTSALAQAKVDLSNSLPVVTVLDPPMVSPSGRYATLILSLAVFLGLVAGIILVLVREGMRAARQYPHNQAFFAAWDHFKGDIAGYVPRRRRLPARVPDRE